MNFFKKKSKTSVDCNKLFARYILASNKKKTPTPDGYRAISLADAIALYPRMIWLNQNPTLGFNIELETSDIWLSNDKTLIIKSGINVWTFDGLSWTDEIQALKNQQLNT